jgi:HD-GYP domain-containing protein (c-di-GMP phosphodiesterase class II)
MDRRIRQGPSDLPKLVALVEQLRSELRVAYDEIIAGWARAMDLRDQQSEGHTQRVAALTVRVGRAMGVPEDALVHVHRGALLHDIGTILIPDAVLLKRGPLSDDEWEMVRRHPEYAHTLLSPISHLREAIDIPYCHHEKWDGTGYPRQLKGDQIPRAARIFSIVDVWDALCSERPHRTAWTRDEAREYVTDHVGKDFDPESAEVFLSMNLGD